MKSLLVKLAKLTAVIAVVAGVVGAVNVGATRVAYADAKADICQGVGLADGSSGCAESGVTVQSAVKTAISLLSYVAGIAAVFMIIVAGVRYITSNGDPSGVKGAKDAIIYAIVGIIVVVISQSIVKFVLNSTTDAKTTTKKTTMVAAPHYDA